LGVCSGGCELGLAVDFGIKSDWVGKMICFCQYLPLYHVYPWVSSLLYARRRLRFLVEAMEDLPWSWPWSPCGQLPWTFVEWIGNLEFIEASTPPPCMAKEEPSLQCICLVVIDVTKMIQQEKIMYIKLRQRIRCIPGLGTGLSGVLCHQKVVVVVGDPPVDEPFVEYEPEPDCHTIVDNPNRTQTFWPWRWVAATVEGPKELQAPGWSTSWRTLQWWACTACHQPSSKQYRIKLWEARSEKAIPQWNLTTAPQTKIQFQCEKYTVKVENVVLRRWKSRMSKPETEINMVEAVSARNRWKVWHSNSCSPRR